MRRTIMLAAVAATLLGIGSAGAATQQQSYQQSRTKTQQQQTTFTPSNTRPAWAAPWQCFTDDGYGRFTPCEGGGKGY